VLIITSSVYAGILLFFFISRIDGFFQLGFIVIANYIVISFVVPFIDVIVVWVLLRKLMYVDRSKAKRL
jgi:hypothetical protein